MQSITVGANPLKADVNTFIQRNHSIGTKQGCTRCPNPNQRQRKASKTSLLRVKSLHTTSSNFVQNSLSHDNLRREEETGNPAATIKPLKNGTTTEVARFD